jgi:tyrosine aminotransferase
MDAPPPPLNPTSPPPPLIFTHKPKPENPTRTTPGDPTVFGNFHSPDILKDALETNLRSEKFNGYCPSHGRPEARTAVAEFYQTATSPLTADDVIIASGGSGALEISMKALLNPGDNILLPQPGFALYQTIAEHYDSKCKFYDLTPESGWEADLVQMESLIDDRTRCILVNNPSNPCGSVFSKAHLEGILAIAEKHRLPIISDEIYAHMCFSGNPFFHIASLTTTVPVLSIGGMAKEFLVPGWRVGWITVHDRNDVLAPIRGGLIKLTQVIIGANTLVQSTLPVLLRKSKDSLEAETMTKFNREYVGRLETHALFTADRLAAIPGLRVVRPQGAMYVMVGVETDQLEGIEDDVQFAQQLLLEECVFVIPGSCFRMKNFFRVVFSAPMEKLTEAYDRIEAFCAKRYTGSASSEPMAKRQKR